MTNNIKKSEKNAQQVDHNDLLCCPFCGRAAFYWIVHRNCWKISCENDCITMPSRFDAAFTSKEQAKKRWNQRKGATNVELQINTSTVNNGYTYWRDAEKEDPSYSKNSKAYLVILKSLTRANHTKTFAGCGKPEIAFWCNRYDSAYKWKCRGSLVVAYWMPLPKFNKKYQLNPEGELPEWI